ncbi:MAG: oxidoreductase, partial [Chitinivibrionales bacterium]|nr:oxidoreductase [Chitinivibrionales bacterium]
MDHGRTPFLSSLLKREDYRVHSWYSGVPSTTPSVQGELFYGKRTAVPAFGFRDHETGRLTSMFNIGTATQVEQRLAASAPGLLEGGSSYANVYAGGADRTAFCFTKTGIGRLLNGLSVLKLLLLAVLHVAALGRVAVLLVIETLLAFTDFIRGVAGRHHFFKELKFIPSRVGVCILLREMVTASVLADVALGVPVIHANFLGYDEQSHRRGPSSTFAHWTLKGIDWSLRRIWNAAHRSSRRDYDVWIYS